MEFLVIMRMVAEDRRMDLSVVCKTDSIPPFRFTTVQFRCLNGPVLVHCGTLALTLFSDLFTQALGLTAIAVAAEFPYTHTHPVLVVVALRLRMGCVLTNVYPSGT